MKTEIKKMFGGTLLNLVILVMLGLLVISSYGQLGSSNAQTFTAQTLITERARQAEEFVDSMGINVHLHYNDTSYGNYEYLIKPKLRELGIRHLRDGIVLERPDKEAMMHELEGLGFKFQMIADPRFGTVVDQLKFIKKFRSILTVEGPNEPDLNLGPNWVAWARDFQRNWYLAVKNDPVTKSISVIAPSLAMEGAFSQLGNINSWADYGNLHNYYGGRNPGTSGWGPGGYGSITWQLAQAAKVTPGRSVISSETGWHNYVDNTGGHSGTPESVVGKYMPRVYLEHFNRGIMRSYPYELIDERFDYYNLEDNFGLLRYDGSPKPAFTALKNLITLLRDDGAIFKPSSLEYSLTGEVNDLRHTLLQKQDGTFYLALWVEAYNWDPGTRREFTPPAQRVTLTANSLFQSAAYCVPNDGLVWRNVNIVKNNISLSVSDKVMLVRLKPSLGWPRTSLLLPVL